MKDILCDDCKKVIGLIEEDALIIDSEFGNIGIEKYCKDCKKKQYDYKDGRDINMLL